MAKKKLELPDFDIDSSLDMPDFDFNVKPIKDKRKPIEKVVSGVKSGVKSGLRNEAAIKRLVKASLPKGYGDALDVAEQSTRSLKELYNSSVKDIRPVLNELKRTTDKLLPQGKKYMPKKLYDQLEKFAKSADVKAGYQRDHREMGIDSSLGDIFMAQSENAAYNRAEDQAHRQIQESIADMRHRDLLGQVDVIRDSVVRLSSYQEKVGVNYQRKSLELQFRQYYATVDLLEEAKRSNAETASFMQALVHNTALPDMAKVTLGDKTGEFLKNKFLTTARDSVFGRRGQFFSNITGNFSKVLGEKISQITSGVGMGLQLGNMMGDMAGGADLSPAELAGQAIGEFVTDMLIEPVGNQIKKRFTSKSSTITKGGHRLGFRVANAQQAAVSWAKNTQYRTGATGVVQDFLRDLVLRSNARETKLQTDNLRNLNDPAPFTRSVSKSITEIIPGYLARMLRELQMMRTGKNDIELTKYDFHRNDFGTESSINKKAFENIANLKDQSSTQGEVNRLLDEVDPDKKLNAQQRQQLGLFLMKSNLGNSLYASAKNMTRATTFKGLGAENATDFARVFKRYYGEAGSVQHAQREEDFAKRLSNMGRYAGDSRAMIQDYANAGMLPFLTSAGIYNPETGSIDEAKLQEYHYGAATTGFGGVAAEGRSRRGMPVRHSTTPALARSTTRNINQNFSFDSSKIIDTIKEESVKPESQAIVEILQRIEAQVAHGIMTYNAGSVDPREAGPWWNRSVASVGKGLFGGAFRAGKWAIGKANSMVNAPLNMAWKATKFAGGLAKGQGRRVLDRIQGFRDVYYPGEAIPRMLGVKIKAGAYRNAITKRVIKTWRDIDGPVEDIEQNRIVLQADEIDKAYVKETMGQKALKALGASVRMASRLADSVANSLGTFYGGAFKVVTWAVKKGYESLDGPCDVYVKDELDSPRLTKVGMQKGLYISKKTGETISKFGDIDGPVLTNEKTPQQRLSLEDIEKGLVDINNKPIHVGLGKLAHLGTAVISTGVKWIAKGMQSAGKVLSGALGIPMKFVSRIFGLDGLIFAGGKQMLSTVEEIRDILKERLPGKKIRAGSIEDLHNRRKAMTDEEARAAGADSGDTKKSGGLMGMLGGLASLFKKKKAGDDADKDSGGGLGSAIGQGAAEAAAGGIFGRAGRLARKIPGIGRLFGKGAAGAAEAAAGSVAKRGILSRGLGALKWGKGLGAGLALAGASHLANASGHTTVGTALDYGSDALMVHSALAGTAGLLGVEGGALGLLGAGAGALATGLGAILASPVLLGALAVGAVAAGGYMAYKHFTKNNMGPLAKMRYVQYGFDPAKPEHWHSIAEAEEIIKKAVTFGGGQMKIDAKQIDGPALLKAFGVDSKDEKSTNSFIAWLNGRFKPVYLTSMMAVHGVAANVDLADVDDKLKGDDKKRYLQMARFDNGPYNVMDSPFPGETLSSGPDQVKAAIAEASAAIEKEGKAQPMDRAKMVAAAGGVAAAGAAGAATMGAGGMPGKPMPKAGQAFDPSKINNYANINNQGVDPGRGNLYIAGSAAALPMQVENGRIDALTAIRYKTYGLVDMEADKIRALARLEDFVKKGIKFDASKVAAWSGSVSDAMEKCGPAFGVESPSNPHAADWAVWFNKRFLVAYLNYLTALRNTTGKDDLDNAQAMMKPDQAIQVATAVLGSAVWQQPASPWPGYTLNMEVKSTNANMQGLKDQAKSSTVPEEKGTDNKTKKGDADKSSVNASGVAAIKQQKDKDQNQDTSFWGKVKGGVSSAASSVSNFASSTWSGVKGLASSAASSLGFGGGAEIQQPGNGTGGDINKIPVPKGNKSYAGMKDTIDAVAKMAGVDPNLLATMTAIESGFDANAKPPNGSAKGLMQFLDSTWAGMMKKYAAKYGIDPNTSAFDPRANLLMGAEFLKSNVSSLKSLGRPLTDTDAYLAHFMGAGGAKQLLQADQNAIAAKLFPGPAANNKNIFYEANGTPRTVGGVYQYLNSLVRSRAKQFGINSTAGSEAIKAASAPKGAAQGAAQGAGADTGATNAATKAAIANANAGPVTPEGNSNAKTDAAQKAQAKPLQPLIANSNAPISLSGGYTDNVQSTASQARTTVAPAATRMDQAKALKAQAQAHADAMVETVGPLGDILGDQLKELKTHTGLLTDVLSAIRDLKGQGAGSGRDASTAAKPPKAAPEPPISMSKATVQ